MPASPASRAVWLAPGLSSRMNARQASAPRATMAALRANPAPRPACQSAGCRSAWPPQEVHSRSAMASAPRGHAPLTSTEPGWKYPRSAAAITASSVQVRDPVTSTRRGLPGGGQCPHQQMPGGQYRSAGGSGCPASAAGVCVGHRGPVA
jgi:hypothetical protein